MKRVLTPLFEKVLVVLVIVAALFLSKFPTLYHFLNTPEGYWFVGHTSWFDSWDINVYLSYIRFGERAGVLLENLHTTVPHKGIFIFQFYTLLGVLNRIFHVSPIALYQIASVVVGTLFICSSYFVIGKFIKDKLFRFITLVIAVLGGGLGWATKTGESLDVAGAGFTSVYSLEIPHQGLSNLLFILAISTLILYAVKRDRSTSMLVF